jgi:hypothetical protein
MDFGKLAKQAQRAIDKRGGTDALKKDLGDLKDIATGPGTPQEKARRAADSLKQSGGNAHPQAPGTSHPEGGPVEDPNAPK